MLRFSGGLVLIQYNGLFRAAAGAVQPHIGLAGMLKYMKAAVKRA